ncbi:MAG: hypothetical protein JXA93_26415, partial [Anaerolineae bacterium]|nr:hypothetical protein [Anaerolineae bacterium]
MTQTNESQNGLVHIGLDPGFGGAKAACIRPGGVQVATVPSVVGVGSTDLGMLSLGSVGRRRRTLQPDQVAFDGVSYLVGENVARYARPVERMDFLRLSDGPELRALFYDVIFRLLGGGRHQASVMAGLPVEVMADKALAGSTLKALRGWMVGEHAYMIDGGGIKLDITNVLVMAQPAGTYFAWGLNDEGKWARSKPDLRAPVAICDIG